MYDCLIIGGGPAGLSAAVYMGRFLRSVVVVDSGHGRSSFSQINDNYLGFPEGIAVRELRQRGRQQAERFGVAFVEGEVATLRKEGRDFVAKTSQGELEASTVILCTGVTDIWPPIANVEEYVGKTLFWCITCDGFRTIGKRLVLFGHDDDAATTACQFRNFTEKITFIANREQMSCCEEKLCAMRDHRIEVVEGELDRVEGQPDRIEAVCLKDGRRIEADLMFSLLGCHPNNALARQLGAKLSYHGYVEVDEEGYTTVPGFFCAGDVSGTHTHQVANAVCEGGEAAQTANYYLYDRYQRNLGDDDPARLNQPLSSADPTSKIENPK